MVCTEIIPLGSVVCRNDHCSTASLDITHRLDSFTSPFENFKANLKLELLDNGYDFKTLEPIHFYFYMDSGRNVYMSKPETFSGSLFWLGVEVPVDFPTDLVSSPRLLWNIQSPLGPAAKPSVLHDVFYRYATAIRLKPVSGSVDHFYINQKIADTLFLRSLQLRGISDVRCYAMYWLLRGFGHIKFNKRRF